MGSDSKFHSWVVVDNMRTLLRSDDSNWPELWKSVFKLLEQDGLITPHQLFMWVEPLKLLSIQEVESGFVARLGAKNDFATQWVRDKFSVSLGSAFSRVTGKPCEILLETILDQPVSAESEKLIKGDVLQTGSPLIEPMQPQSAPVIIKSYSQPGFDPRYTFETFVVGASNQFAHASSYAVSENPAKHYNPLFLYSAPGLGKTHLLHAIGNHILSKNSSLRVLYISAERFVNELIESIQHSKMTQFRTKYRESYDVLLFDDIQFIAGKEKTEEEFFHTFNALHANKRQIVVTSDRSPKEIEKLEERLRTRFEWGLIADISVPEIETRIAILKTKAERDDIYLPDDVAIFLATYIKSNVRELEGVLIKLQAHASLTGAELSLELAKEQLKLVVPEQGTTYSIEAIQSAVSKYFKIKAADFKSNSKQRSVARPRQIAMYLIRKYTNLGYKEIGHYFGGRDHTTILHACREIEKKMDLDSETKQSVESIQNLL